MYYYVLTIVNLFCGFVEPLMFVKHDPLKTDPLIFPLWSMVKTRPSGKHTNNYGTSPFYNWVNQRTQWPCSMSQTLSLEDIHCINTYLLTIAIEVVVSLWPFYGWVPSGKRLHNYGKIHHFIAGKIHYFYGHFQLLCNRLPECKPSKSHERSHEFPLSHHKTPLNPINTPSIHITMERSTIFHGKIHHKWWFSIAILTSPECKPSKSHERSHEFPSSHHKTPLVYQG